MPKILATLVALFVATNSVATTSGATPTDPAALAQELKAAIGDELYISETDAPWTPVHFATPVDSIDSEAALRLALSVPAERTLDVMDAEWLADFWDYYLDVEIHGEATAAAYAALRAAMTDALVDHRFVKVGHEDGVVFDVYLLGRLPDGRLVGLQSLAVET